MIHSQPISTYVKQNPETLIRLSQRHIVEAAAGFPRTDMVKLLEGEQRHVVLVKLMTYDSALMILDQPVASLGVLCRL